MPVVIHYLIVFDHAAGKLVSVEEFRDPKAAVRAYEQAEERHRSEDNLEIVLVGADSLETIHTTHGHYFATEPTSRYLSGV